ncbi:hypothetical protein [Bradyrhizobium sp. 141]|uniref:hypothetical protein n=1 Tax=Bradyrhizobium sp. 141 TaxID=2782617 RepID=UPI001FF9C210|nr:hypothetical protein [Bradyrhizobium sp. 141]MCK1717336.1 hypothetical protein [Bradyrhizobium sp. 141]
MRRDALDASRQLGVPRRLAMRGIEAVARPAYAFQLRPMLADDAAPTCDEGQWSRDGALNGNPVRERSASTAAPTALPS